MAIFKSAASYVESAIQGFKNSIAKLEQAEIMFQEDIDAKMFERAQLQDKVDSIETEVNTLRDQTERATKIRRKLESLIDDA